MNGSMEGSMGIGDARKPLAVKNTPIIYRMLLILIYFTDYPMVS